MNRRNKKAISGFVKFPTDKMESTGEGGTFVRLVVVPNESENNGFMQCAGGYNHIIFDESYLGDDFDEELPNIDISSLSTVEFINYSVKETDHYKNKIKKHFPNFYNESSPDKLVSIPYLAIVTIGSTGWSNGEWICTYNDLTDGGKNLYHLLENLYKDTGKIHIQTWIDT